MHELFAHKLFGILCPEMMAYELEIPASEWRQAREGLSFTPRRSHFGGRTKRRQCRKALES